MADQSLQEIKDRLNLVDLISGYVPVKKAGVNFKAACPFHNEKTPSLVISPQKQVWHCFGCGEGGDIFGFVMRYENMEFKEALKLLAAKAGVVLPQYRPEDPKQQNEKELLFRINAFAAEFYHQFLLKNSAAAAAREYLEKRGLTAGTIERWKIGYAPEDYHALERALAQKGVAKEALVRAGVSTKNEQGQIYDRFRGRVTFPIFNYSGEAVGFSARILKTDDRAAKYINSPETAIYNKSQVLFGLNFAKEAIRKKDQAVIVEGQMDCIAAHQGGFENTVASSGTALTEQQLTMLGRLTKNLKFCFDSDAAGLAASRRAGESALAKGFRLKVITLKAAKDPDELIRKSPGLWEKAVSEAIWFLDYYIQAAENFSDKDPVSQKHYLSSEVVPFLGFIADPLEQDHYIKQMVEKFDISERTIREQIKSKKPAAEAGSVGEGFGEAKNLASVLEKEVLGGMLGFENFRTLVISQGSMDDFENPEIRGLVSPLFSGQLHIQDPESPLAKEALFMVESQTAESPSPESYYTQLTRAFALLRLQAIKRQQKSLTLEIKRSESTHDIARTAELNKLSAKLSQERVAYEKQL